MYQETRLPLAGGRTFREGQPALVDDAFHHELRFIARRLLFSVPRLEVAERDLLYDLGRTEVRYPMKTLRALLAIASRSLRLEDQEAIPELMRAEILRQSAPSLCVRAAFDIEAPVTGPANEAQRAFELQPDRTTWERCRDALQRQLAATRHALDAVLTWRAPA